MSDNEPKGKDRAPSSRAMGQFSAVEDSDGPGTTIVGAQPPRRGRNKVNVPAGVEKVLYLAATDRRFHQALLADRDAAVETSGVELKASELAMLRAAPAAQLEATIAALDVTPENLGRRRFMKAVAASAVTLAAAKAAGGCGEDDISADMSPGFETGGIRPSDAGDDLTTDMPHGFDSGGIRPDWYGNQDIPTDAGGPGADAGTGPDMPQPDSGPKDGGANE